MNRSIEKEGTMSTKDIDGHEYRPWNPVPPDESQVDISVGHAGQTYYKVSLPLWDFKGIKVLPIDKKSPGVLIKSIGVGGNETVINIAEGTEPWELKVVNPPGNTDPTTQSQTADDDEHGDFVYDLPQDVGAPEIRIKRWVIVDKEKKQEEKGKK